MQAMDRQYLETPFYGSQRMRAWLERQGGSKPEAGAAADAHHGVKGHLPGSPHQPAGTGASDLSLSVGKG